MAAIQTRVAYLEAMEYLDECFFVLNQEEHYGNRSD
jgi:hypothetical protein